jgi:hypothetical protein
MDRVRKLNISEKQDIYLVPETLWKVSVARKWATYLRMRTGLSEGISRFLNSLMPQEQPVCLQISAVRLLRQEQSKTCVAVKLYSWAQEVCDSNISRTARSV